MTKRTVPHENGRADTPNRIRESDTVMNRVLVVLLYTLALMMCMFWVHKNNSTIELFVVNSLNPVLLVLSTLILGVAVYYAVWCKKNSADASLRVLSPSTYLYAAAVFFGVCWLYKPMCSANMDILIIAVIVTAACYFVYYMYPVSTFSYAVVTGAGLIMIRLLINYGESHNSLVMVARVLTMVYGAAIIILSIIAQAKGGKLLFLKLGADYRCWYTIITGVLLIVSGIGALFIPVILGYMTIVYVALFFVLIIIGTILML